jgi:transposase
MLAMRTRFAGLSRSAVEQTCSLALERAERAEQALAQATRHLAAAESDRDTLAQSLAALRDSLFKPKSERTRPSDAGQTTFLGAEVQQEDGANSTDDEQTEQITYERKKRTGRKPVAKDLPTKEITLRASDAERIGPNGEQLVCIGYEETVLLDLVPERLQRLIIRREKLGMPGTGEYVSTVAPPARLVAKSKATDQFMLTVALRKYQQGLPLYRQTQLYNALGAELAENYLGECCRHIATAFAPVAAAIRAQVLANRWVHADETPIRQLKNTQPGGDATTTARTAYLWAWVGGNQVSFHYGPTRSNREVRDVLGIPYDPDDPYPRQHPPDFDPDCWEHGEYIGFLICDGLGSYNTAIRGGVITRVACWVHARRAFKYFEDRDANAARVVRLFNAIFSANRKIVRAAEKRTGISEDERYDFIAQQRQQILPEKIAALEQEIDLLAPLYSPDTHIGKGITYLRNRWDDLQVFLDHGFLPMENNAAERAIRPIAVGRKAWLFVGSEDGGSWAADLFSIIESCRLQKIDPRTYCEHVLKQIVQAPDREKLDYTALTPAVLRGQFRR